MPVKYPVVRSAGVDYFTGSSAEKKANQWINNLGQHLLNQERLAGNDISSFWLRNFSGLTCGSVQLATNGEFVMIRLSGHLAKTYWREAAETCSKISRLDLETTVLFTGSAGNLASKLERRALQFCRDHDSRTMVELKRNNKTGQTLYLGSRKSDRFIRIYDKGKESRLPELANHWRAEVELHRGLSLTIGKQLVQVEDVATAASQLVGTYLSKVGIHWPSISYVRPLVAQLHMPQRSQSSIGKRLLWLEAQVAPTIARLREEVPREKLLKILGLEQEVLDE